MRTFLLFLAVVFALMGGPMVFGQQNQTKMPTPQPLTEKAFESALKLSSPPKNPDTYKAAPYAKPGGSPFLLEKDYKTGKPVLAVFPMNDPLIKIELLTKEGKAIDKPLYYQYKLTEPNKIEGMPGIPLQLGSAASLRITLIVQYELTGSTPARIRTSYEIPVSQSQPDS